MATKLTEAATAKRDAYVALLDEAKETHGQAADDLRTAQSDYTDLMAQRSSLEKAIADIRKAMPTATMPADVEDLAAQLRAKQISLRKVRAELLKVNREIASQNALQTSAQKQLKALSRSLTDAENALAVAELDESRHLSWRDSVSAGTITDLAAKAQEMLDAVGGSAVVEDEDAAVTAIRAAKLRTDDSGADIPEILRTRARERAAAVNTSSNAYAALLQHVEDKRYQLADANEGISGASAKLAYAFQVAEQAFGNIVSKSQSRYDEAVSLINSIVNSTALTQAEQDRIADVALAVDDAALVNEKTRDEKAAALLTAQIALKQGIVDLLYDDIDEDPDTATALDALRSAVDTAQGELDTADSALTQDMVDRLDAWEVSVPDHIWANLVAYDRANVLLSDIVNADTSALDTALANAEATLAQARVDEDKALRLHDYLEDTATLQASGLEYARTSRHEQMLSAVRGDN